MKIGDNVLCTESFNEFNFKYIKGKYYKITEILYKGKSKYDRNWYKINNEYYFPDVSDERSPKFSSHFINMMKDRREKIRKLNESR